MESTGHPVWGDLTQSKLRDANGEGEWEQAVDSGGGAESTLDDTKGIILKTPSTGQQDWRGD